MEMVHIIRFGEIWIKGRNRRMFLGALERNLRQALGQSGSTGTLTAERGRFFVTEESDDPWRTADRLARVPGVVSVSSGARVEKDVAAIASQALALIRTLPSTPASFKVESKRADKRFPIPSPELSRKVAEWLLTHNLDIPVDVHHPEMVVGVEIQRTGAYVFCRTAPGVGGLPTGVSGTVALLLSGGIDSPVAGWRLQRRGVAIMPVYFHGFPFTSDRVKDKIERLSGILAANQTAMDLQVVNFTPVLTALKQQAPEKLMIVLMRRFMVRIAEQLAIRHGCQALATGDNLGQVASQTLENLSCVSDACRMMVLRPLLSMDKVDIIREARRIGTYEISIEPHEDCCTLFVPRFPEIYGKLDEIREAEQAIAIETLVHTCLQDVESRRMDG